jgi:hypothetical protein
MSDGSQGELLALLVLSEAELMNSNGTAVESSTPSAM